MLNQEDLTNAFIAKILGLVEYKDEKEFWWRENKHKPVTVEFVDNTPTKAIVRGYYDDNDQICMQAFHLNGNMHGEYKVWSIDGRLVMFDEYADGKKNGKSIVYTKSAIIIYEAHHKNGKDHGDCKRWNTDGTLLSWVIYDNGVLIKQVLV